MRIKFVLKSEHVLASKGAWRPTPTQSTCLYYCDVMKLVSVTDYLHGDQTSFGWLRAVQDMYLEAETAGLANKLKNLI